MPCSADIDPLYDATRELINAVILENGICVLTDELVHERLERSLDLWRVLRSDHIQMQVA